MYITKYPENKMHFKNQNNRFNSLFDAIQNSTKNKFTKSKSRKIKITKNHKLKLLKISTAIKSDNAIAIHAYINHQINN